jgi:hypothetical protein
MMGLRVIAEILVTEHWWMILEFLLGLKKGFLLTLAAFI